MRPVGKEAPDVTLWTHSPSVSPSVTETRAAGTDRRDRGTMLPQHGILPNSPFRLSRFRSNWIPPGTTWKSLTEPSSQPICGRPVVSPGGADGPSPGVEEPSRCRCRSRLHSPPAACRCCWPPYSRWVPRSHRQCGPRTAGPGRTP